MGEHAGFILASYGFAALIFVGLVLWLWLDRTATVKELARLEEMGVRRRSEARSHE